MTSSYTVNNDFICLTLIFYAIQGQWKLYVFHVKQCQLCSKMHVCVRRTNDLIIYLQKHAEIQNIKKNNCVLFLVIHNVFIFIDILLIKKKYILYIGAVYIFLEKF